MFLSNNGFFSSFASYWGGGKNNFTGDGIWSWSEGPDSGEVYYFLFNDEIINFQIKSCENEFCDKVLDVSTPNETMYLKFGKDGYWNASSNEENGFIVEFGGNKWYCSRFN
jgi:hypothetical protein